MIPKYPDGLPCPLRDGYGFTPVNNIVRTDMQSGRARQRIDFPKTPDTIQLRWIMNSPQASVFQAWAEQIVGAGWFEIELLSPLGFETEEVRFMETPVGGNLTGKFSWEFRVNCERRERKLLEPGWAEILPEFVLMADIFDKAMNREWPPELLRVLVTQDGRTLITESGNRLILE
ncbi:hypothetical protein [Pseudomonas tolaasii]